MKLYYHKTDGGAEYLMDTFIKCENGHKEGVFEGAKYVVRIDGDITKDAEISLKHYICPSCGYNISGLKNKELEEAGIIKRETRDVPCLDCEGKCNHKSGLVEYI